jgi:hypothetical protein
MKPAPGHPQAELDQAELGQAELVMAALCALPLPSGDRRAILASGPIRKSGDTNSS